MYVFALLGHGFMAQHGVPIFFQQMFYAAVGGRPPPSQAAGGGMDGDLPTTPANLTILRACFQLPPTPPCRPKVHVSEWLTNLALKRRPLLFSCQFVRTLDAKLPVVPKKSPPKLNMIILVCRQQKKQIQKGRSFCQRPTSAVQMPNSHSKLSPKNLDIPTSQETSVSIVCCVFPTVSLVYVRGCIWFLLVQAE